MNNLAKTFFIFTTALSVTALADAPEPACSGSKVDISILGNYMFELGRVKIESEYLAYQDGPRFRAWSCERSGMSILFFEFSKNDYESRVIAMSEKMMFDFGEVEGSTIRSNDTSDSVGLDKDGLSTLMKLGEVKVLPKL